MKLDAFEANPAMADMLTRCNEIMLRKGKDYAGTPGDLRNFNDCAEDYGITPRQALGVLMDKQTRSLKRFLRGEELAGEPVEERIADTINFCLLLAKMVAEEGDEAAMKIVGPPLAPRDLENAFRAVLSRPGK